MRKVMLLCFLLIISIATVGCNSNDISLEENEVLEIRISEFKNFGKINTDVLLRVTDDKDIDTIINSLESANKIDGILDVAEMHYDIKILYKSQKPSLYHVYLDETGGTILDVPNTSSGYSMNEQSVNTIKEIIEK